MRPRHKQLLDILREHGQTDIAMLVQQLGASEATVRRDLTRLEREGLLSRTFGGARLLEAESLVARTFEQKRERMRQAKERIARRAAQMVQPGMTVALDSGTTVWSIAAALKERGPFRAVTSALAPVEELGPVENIEVHLTGGQFRLINLDFIGPKVVECFEAFHADVAFIGTDGFMAGEGSFAPDAWSASIVQAIARCADRVVLALDHEKFDKHAPFRALPPEAIDVILTDSGLPPEVRDRVRSGPYELIIAE